MFKAKLLAWVAVAAGAYQVLISDGWMNLIQFKLLRMHQWLDMKEPWTFHERLDSYFYAASQRTCPRILGTDIRQLGLRLTLDVAMWGIGGLMGIMVATSVIIGAFANFVILAPLMIQAGDIAPRIGPTGAVVADLARRDREPVVALVGRDDDGGRLAREPDRPARSHHERLPRHGKGQGEGRGRAQAHRVPALDLGGGHPDLQRAGRWVTHDFFNVPWLLAFISLPLIFVLSIICANSMALTSWTPTGALSKITQFSMGAIDRANPASNIIPAGMTAEIAANASNLLSDIKPGYMLGAKPRQQAIGHVIGIAAGALCCVPLFYLLFLQPDAHGVRSPATIISDQFAFPAALQWKGVAELIAKGISSCCRTPPSCR